MNAVSFPALSVAARRLDLDAATEAEIAEAVLHAVDCGADEQEAIRMALAEFERRRRGFSG